MENRIKLESLQLTNFATFKAQNITFDNGLNSIVGETGSGKSLILDALQFILGQRADKKIIRKGSDFASLEAVFSVNCSDVKKYFMNIGFPFEDNQIIIKRIIQSSGKSKVLLNHQISTIKTIQDFSLMFIDFVGQFSNQKLLTSKYQLEILDSYANLTNEVRAFQVLYGELTTLKNQLSNDRKNEGDRLRKIDYLQFQIQEISELSPSTEMENSLIEKKSFLQNFETKTSINQELMHLIDGEQALLDTIRLIKSKTISKPELFKEESLTFIEESLENFRDFHSQLSLEINQEFKGEDLENVIDELDRYQKVKRKFGPEVVDVLVNLNTFQNELELLNSTQCQVEEIEKEITKLEKIAVKKAQVLSKERAKASKLFAKEICQKLKKLNMPEVQIDIEISKSTTLSLTGFDQLYFKIETNPGEGQYLLQDIASGGELSRILLVMREIHANHNNNISIFLFDEIDTGIGGSTAVAMGEVLKEISGDSQVIAITHLPQIAQFSDFLIEVSKKTSSGADKRTESYIKEHLTATISDFARDMTPLN